MKTLKSQLAPAYNAFLKKYPPDEHKPRTAERFQRLLEDAVARRVSDIHVDPGTGGYHIRFRLDGALHDVATLGQAAGERLIRFVATRAELDVPKPSEPQEGRASFEVSGGNWELRYCAVPAALGEKVTMRILGANQIGKPIGELGLAGGTFDRIRDWTEDSSGMLLVAGLTGSGKTTTLYALLHEFKQRERAIVTIEDPIEYTVDGCTQIEVNEEAGLSFAVGLKTMLRLDPDYLLVGEIRDPESAATAIDAASAGRLLMSSIHSRDAAGVITTLRNFGVRDSEIATALEVVVAQRLVRKLCTACRERGAATVSEAGWLDRFSLAPPEQCWHAVGCEQCSQTGFDGMIGIFEVWRLDPESRRLILKHPEEAQLRGALIESGHESLAQDGLRKAGEGLTTLAELRETGAMWAR